jgi:peptidoglycan hydrolase-like protein with peptidoglycan-binding domain
MVLDSDSMMAARMGNLCGFIISRGQSRLPNREENEMKKLPLTALSVLLLLSLNVAAQNQNANTNSNGATNANKSTKVNRGPVFRASADQIKQAQAILKQRGFYSSEQTGKLDANTRAGLRKYQQAESMKVTGTLNKVTLVKMGITLTEKQKAM